MSSTSSPASPVVDMARSIKKGSVVVAVGTKKGGFLFHSPDRKKWSVAGPFMEGGAVYHMILDPRDGRTVYASAPMGSEPWGPAIYRGRAEEEPKATQAFPKFKEGSDLSVSRIWHIEPGPSEAPDTIYAGAEPAALFRSGDGSLFQQNHCGTYHRGPDGGEWTEVTKGLPSDFGFPIAVHPRQKHTAFVAPLVGAGNRVFPKGQMAVWKTTNRGKAWRRSTKGLPGPGAYLGVLREGMAVDEADPIGVYAGTNTGQLFASRDEGESWKMISASVTKKPPMPRRIRAAMMIDVAPPPPPATARIEVATIPVRSASRPNTKTVMCWAGDRPMSQSLSPIPAIVPPHPKIVGEFARTSKRATNATIRRNNRTKTSRSSA